MSDPTLPRSTRTLPATPNLEQQKKQARELLDAVHAGDPTALTRFREHHPRLASLPDTALGTHTFSLHEAQLVLAREYGFASWTKLKAHIDDALAARRTHPFVRELSYYDDRAHGLLAVVPDGVPSALEQVRAWHPRFSGASDDDIRAAALTIDDARLIYAREHGFATWEALGAHLADVAAGGTPDPFMAVFEAGKARDWPRAQALLRAHPDLVRARGTNGNTLLNLAGSLVACPAPNAIASEPAEDAARRLVPLRLLLSAGADVDQANDRGWTPLHQAGYRNDPAMVTLLLAAGARVDVEAHGAGGTPLVAALFWGHREASELLAAAGITPRNLRVAAGLGRVDLVQACFTSDGRLTPAARASRGFYRPHSGFPTWSPSDDPQEVLDEALVWAAMSDRVDVLPLLVKRGARVSADPYRGTPLVRAASTGRVGAARWLLDHGADVNQRSTFGGAEHGVDVTALHIAAQNNNVDVARLLVKRGADLEARDALYHGTPAGWAEHGGSKEVIELLLN
jgi:ankyrin repeat protein